MGRVGFVKSRQVAREEVDIRGFVATHDVLIKRLQSKFTRAAACRLGRGFARAGCGMLVCRRWLVS
jgi:hypothetical protein